MLDFFRKKFSTPKNLSTINFPITFQQDICEVLLTISYDWVSIYFIVYSDHYFLTTCNLLFRQYPLLWTTYLTGDMESEACRSSFFSKVVARGTGFKLGKKLRHLLSSCNPRTVKLIFSIFVTVTAPLLFSFIWNKYIIQEIISMEANRLLVENTFLRSLFKV